MLVYGFYKKFDSFDLFLKKREWTVRFVFIVLFFFLCGKLLPVMPDTGLDPSWIAALNYARENQIRFGKDFIFTYGPLAFLDANVYWHNQWMVLLAYGAMSLAAGGVLPLKNRQDFLRFLLLLISGFLCPGFEFFSILLPFCFWFSAETMMQKNKSHKDIFVALLLCIIGACFILNKFMYVVPFLCASFVSDCFLFYKRKRIFYTPCLIAGVVVFWFVCGQKAQDFCVWLYGSFLIASYYAEAMSFYHSSSLWHMLMVLCSFEIFLVLLFSVFIRMEKTRLEKILLFFLTMSIVFTSMKHGFIRCDVPHLYPFLVAQLLLISVFFKKMPKYFGVLFGVDCILCGIFFYHSWFPPTNDLRKYRQESDRRFAEIASYADSIPELKRMKGKSIDSYPFDLAEIIYAGHRYHPRCIPQSYSVYSPWLLKKNAESLTGSSAPSYILWRICGLDKRLPSTEDSVSWPVLLQKYSYESAFYLPSGASPHNFSRSKEYNKVLLLKQKEKSVPLQLFPLSETVTEFDKPVSVPVQPGKMLWMSVRLEYTLCGRLAGLFYRPPFVYLTFKKKTGPVKNFRLLPAVINTPFLISPLLETSSDLEALLCGKIPEEPSAGELQFSTNWFAFDPDCPSNSSFLYRIWKIPFTVFFYTSDYPKQ